MEYAIERFYNEYIMKVEYPKESTGEDPFTCGLCGKRGKLSEIPKENWEKGPWWHPECKEKDPDIGKPPEPKHMDSPYPTYICPQAEEGECSHVRCFHGQNHVHLDGEDNRPEKPRGCPKCKVIESKEPNDPSS